MVRKPVKLWGKGAVTIPKKWREKWGTDDFLLEENAKGYLVIKPILPEVVEYEHELDPEDGHYYSGLRFPGGMPADEFVRRFEAAEREITREEKRRRGTRRSKKKRH